MKTVTETIYIFSELPKDAQQKAISNNIDIHFNHTWYDFIEEDLKEINCKLLEFDLYYNTIKIKLLTDAETVASQILSNHGESCNTYKIAKELLCNEIDEEQFLKQLQKDYLNSLQIHEDYLRSDEAIIETFEANDYYFDLNGKIRG
jgi:hypothetical protein